MGLTSMCIAQSPFKEIGRGAAAVNAGYRLNAIIGNFLARIESRA